MKGSDELRLRRLREGMAEAGVDALVCRLPENVVYLANYWPHHGFSLAIFARDGSSRVLLPEIEEQYADQSWSEVVPFGWGLLKDDDLYATLERHLTEARDAMGLREATIAVEKGFEVVGPSYRVAEPVVPAGPTAELLAGVFGGASLVAADGLLAGLRSRKTPFEIERLRLANEVAGFGLGAFRQAAAPGKKESELSASAEEAIRSQGVGHNGARLVRGFAEVGAGMGSYKGYLLVPSTDRIVQEGDLVMIELATVVDGYWSDLTRVVVAGDPDERQREVYELVLTAQKAAASQMRPQVAFAEVDAAAREVIEAAGYGEYFLHITGHGVGLRYHEFVPILAPGTEGVLAEGMVSSVEPGIYIPEWGGIRIEDNVAVGAEGPHFLSTYDRTLP